MATRTERVETLRQRLCVPCWTMHEVASMLVDYQDEETRLRHEIAKQKAEINALRLQAERLKRGKPATD